MNEYLYIEDNACEMRIPAKINLVLDVLGRRPDGYHEVRMIMQRISLYDTVRIEKKDTPGFTLSCSEAGIPTDGRNLAVKAAAAFFEAESLPGGLNITLHKEIPAAAGLAGGSADAAAVILLINRLFGLGLDLSRLAEIGLKIGADVPYCLCGGTALSEGIGEKLTALPGCPDCFILLVKIPEGASTGAVYTAFDALEDPLHPDVDEGIRALEAGDLPRLCRVCENSLEAVTKKMLPGIAEVEKNMLDAGARSACMSGSGPTVFGIFDDEKTARDAESRLKGAFPGCFAALVRPVG